MTASTIQLLICLAALIWIVWLFLGYGAKHARNEDTKVHTLYLSGIGTLLILELVVYICLQASVDKRTIMDTVAFGATLSSLIMSVLAIIFTITSSKGNDRTVGRIEGAIKQLETTAHGLIRFSEIAHDIDKKTDSLINRIDELHSFEENKWSTLSSKLSSDLNGVHSSKIGTEYPKDYINEIYKEYILRVSFFGALGILSCVYSFETKRKDAKLSRFNPQKVFEFLEIDPPNPYVDYVNGFIMSTSCLDLINISIDKDEFISVYNIYDGIELMLRERVRNQILQEKEENSNEILNEWQA